MAGYCQSLRKLNQLIPIPLLYFFCFFLPSFCHLLDLRGISNSDKPIMNFKYVSFLSLLLNISQLLVAYCMYFSLFLSPKISRHEREHLYHHRTRLRRLINVQPDRSPPDSCTPWSSMHSSIRQYYQYDRARPYHVLPGQTNSECSTHPSKTVL